jgi:hypothetical protein
MMSCKRYELWVTMYDLTIVIPGFTRIMIWERQTFERLSTVSAPRIERITRVRAGSPMRW